MWHIRPVCQSVNNTNMTNSKNDEQSWAHQTLEIRWLKAIDRQASAEHRGSEKQRWRLMWFCSHFSVSLKPNFWVSLNAEPWQHKPPPQVSHGDSKQHRTILDWDYFFSRLIHNVKPAVINSVRRKEAFNSSYIMCSHPNIFHICIFHRSPLSILQST